MNITFRTVSFKILNTVHDGRLAKMLDGKQVTQVNKAHQV